MEKAKEEVPSNCTEVEMSRSLGCFPTVVFINGIMNSEGNRSI